MRPVPLHRLLLPYVAFLIAAIALAIFGASTTADAHSASVTFLGVNPL